MTAFSLLGNGTGEIGRREYAEPCAGFKSGDDLPDRGYLRKGWLPLYARHAIGAQFPRTDLLGSRDQADEHEIDLTAQQVT